MSSDDEGLDINILNPLPLHGPVQHIDRFHECAEKSKGFHLSQPISGAGSVGEG